MKKMTSLMNKIYITQDVFILFLFFASPSGAKFEIDKKECIRIW